MLAYLRPAVIMIVTLTILTGMIYPFALTGVAQVVFPSTANGSPIIVENRIVGSSLIGQSFTSDRYFWPRPSAAGSGYDAAASSGSNLGPTSQKLIDRIRADQARLAAADGSNRLPADAVTASGSGLDPDISPAFAKTQVTRVARARGMTVEAVQILVERSTSYPEAGVFGEPRVNVLHLNLALDGVKS